MLVLKAFSLKYVAPLVGTAGGVPTMETKAVFQPALLPGGFAVASGRPIMVQAV
jgi:hypothetical protein